MKYTYLTPGPSELYFTVDYHLKQALKNGVPSISHRSKQFQAIYASVKNKLPELLGLPDDYKIFFMSSATEIWERITQNLIASESFHFTNGAFANKFIDTVKDLGRVPDVYKVDEGTGFNLESIMIKEKNELISITQNETSTGTRFPLEDIHLIRKAFPDKLISVDAVSSIPYEKFDFNDIDTLYFSVQKCFGLPSGLGVWLVNERCIDRAFQLKGKGQRLGSYHSIPSLLKLYEKDQTPETPNVLDIYLLSKVIEDMLMKGITQIRREIEYKSAVIYQSLENNPSLEPFVKDPNIRSKTVIVAETDFQEDIMSYLHDNRFIAGAGYGKHKKQHIRIANFPTHSKESFERLADLIDSMPIWKS